MCDACPCMTLVEVRGQHFAVCCYVHFLDSPVFASPVTSEVLDDRHRLLGLALHGSGLNTGLHTCVTCILLSTESPAHATVYCFVFPGKKCLFYLICIGLYVLENF